MNNVDIGPAKADLFAKLRDWLMLVDEAMNMSETSYLEQRVAVLEREIVALRRVEKSD